MNGDTIILDIPLIAEDPWPGQPTSAHWHFPYEYMDAAETMRFNYQHWARKRSFSHAFFEYLFDLQYAIALKNAQELNEQCVRFVFGLCGNVYELRARLECRLWEPMTSWHDFPNWLEEQGVHYR